MAEKLQEKNDNKVDNTLLHVLLKFLPNDEAHLTLWSAAELQSVLSNC